MHLAPLGQGLSFYINFSKVKATRDAYIKRLNGIYSDNLERVSVQ